ncbi:helix-turn-helix domain-containing protein [Anaeropeptidivorans aminofermentans]|uniref:helix-turn-helix domain-containing protein n=1 Tax=Anaeropeptidivorans aminofermentans TaxID=2934315 RepID=UPI002024F513|nr:helix-turn-helix transcriptional regulator [Anaeropeptidivorans aminofermentans]
MYQRLKDLRNDRDLNQEDIAKYLNVKQAAYSKYELGQRNMTPEVLIKLAEFHNTSIDYLLGITDEKIPYQRSKNNSNQ